MQDDQFVHNLYRSAIRNHFRDNRHKNRLFSSNYCYLLQVYEKNTFNVRGYWFPMTLDYIPDRITREEFLGKIYAKTESESSLETAKSHLNNLDFFCQDKYNRETETVLSDLREDMKETRSITKSLRFLDEFVKWLLEDHPNIMSSRGVHKSVKFSLKRKNRNTVPVYFATIRKYLSQVGGIRIHNDDIKMDVTKPKTDSGDYEDEEAEPLTAEQARRVIELTTDIKTIALYHTLNDTGFRISEAGQIQEKHIDFTKNPVEIFLPKNNSKGKNAGGIHFVRDETAKRLEILCANNEEHYVFKMHDKQSTMQFRRNHLARIRKTYNKLGMNQCYKESGRHKYNLHSWRKRCATEYARKNGEALAHGYIRHRKYLQMYFVKSKEEKIEYFKRAIEDLAIDEIEKIRHKIDEKEKEIQDMKKKQQEAAREAVFDIINNMTSEEVALLVKKKN